MGRLRKMLKDLGQDPNTPKEQEPLPKSFWKKKWEYNVKHYDFGPRGPPKTRRRSDTNATDTSITSARTDPAKTCHHPSRRRSQRRERDRGRRSQSTTDVRPGTCTWNLEQQLARAKARAKRFQQKYPLAPNE